jgi:hypothetical protein
MLEEQRATRWEGSAPEAYLLLHFAAPEGKRALQLAVLELVARRRLRLHPVRRTGARGRAWRDTVLAGGDGPADPLPAPLQTLLDLHAAQPAWRFPVWGGPGAGDEWGGPGGLWVQGVEVRRFVAAVRERFGSLAGFLAEGLRPALVERGWVHQEPYRALRVIPRKRWALTPGGVAAQRDLRARVAYGDRALEDLVRDDPRRALDFLALAGAALLVMPDALRHASPLYAHLGAQGRAQSVGPAGDGTLVAGDAAASGALDAPPAGAPGDPLARDILASSILSGLELGAADGAGGAGGAGSGALGIVGAVEAAFGPTGAGLDGGGGFGGFGGFDGGGGGFDGGGGGDSGGDSGGGGGGE